MKGLLNFLSFSWLLWWRMPSKDDDGDDQTLIITATARDKDGNVIATHKNEAHKKA